jgi:hypothetical protein
LRRDLKGGITSRDLYRPAEKRRESEGYPQSLIDFFIMWRSRPRSNLKRRSADENIRRPEDVVGW